MSKELLDKLRTRLASASTNDRRYERPMNWEEAEALILMMPNPSSVAQKKLETLKDQGWELSGVSISKQSPDGSWRHGIVTDGGFVGWMTQ